VEGRRGRGGKRGTTPVANDAPHRLSKLVDAIDPKDIDEKVRTSLLDNYKDKANAFNSKLYDLIRLTPVREEIPKTKIVLRLAPGFDLYTTGLDEEGAVTLMVAGPTQEIFPSQLPQQWLSWANL
jgi:hypothetical protein